ncbi:MAG: hypothetical protein CMJ74_05590 [Planctomycetaceae bacterium]|nr:hypothetical protein [Planctomycetaceae bacterium]
MSRNHQFKIKLGLKNKACLHPPLGNHSPIRFYGAFILPAKKRESSFSPYPVTGSVVKQNPSYAILTAKRQTRDTQSP